MNLEDEIMEMFPKIQKLPTNASQNLTKSGKRKPMTQFIAHSLYNIKLDPLKFQRTASVYYKTHRIGNLVTLINEINSNTLIIDFNRHPVGRNQYISMKLIRNNRFLCTFDCVEPLFNSHLFQKIVSKRLL